MTDPDTRAWIIAIEHAVLACLSTHPQRDKAIARFDALIDETLTNLLAQPVPDGTLDKLRDRAKSLRDTAQASPPDFPWSQG